jgi:integrase
MVPKGLKRVVRELATGEVRIYWYHRATGKRLKHDPETAEGMLEVAALDARASATAAAQNPRTGSYAALWDQYASEDNSDWTGLAPRTRSDYQKVRDWLGKAAEKPVGTLDAAQVYKLRDKANREKGRRFANYVVQVLRLTLTWGKPRKLAGGENGAIGVKAVRKPKAARKVNRAWSLAELEAFVTDCPPQLLMPFSLGLFASMREGDALIVTLKAYDGLTVGWFAGKNGEWCEAPASGPFKELLDKRKAAKLPVVQLSLNSYGEPWTESGFRATFFKRVRKLTDAGALKPGCTFHGLRHTVAVLAREGGASEFATAAAIGDRSTAMAAVYGRDADRQGAQMDVLTAVHKRLENIDWKTEGKTRPPASAAGGAK